VREEKRCGGRRRESAQEAAYLTAHLCEMHGGLHGKCVGHHNTTTVVQTHYLIEWPKILFEERGQLSHSGRWSEQGRAV
jgi:hypothetical protein